MDGRRRGMCDGGADGRKERGELTQDRVKGGSDNRRCDMVYTLITIGIQTMIAMFEGDGVCRTGWYSTRRSHVLLYHCIMIGQGRWLWWNEGKI